MDRTAARRAEPATGRLRPETALADLFGVGAARGRAVAEEGFETAEDLLSHAPARYEDRSRFARLADLRALPSGRRATLRVRIVSARLLRTRRRGFTILQAKVTDGVDTAPVVWFNQPYLARHLGADRELILYGAWSDEVRGGGLRNPELELVPATAGPDAAVHTGRIVPVYRRLGPLSPRQIRRLMHDILEALPEDLVDPLPGALLEATGLPGRLAALRATHFPAPGTPLADLMAWRTAAQRRLIYEEFLLLALAFDMKRAQRAGSTRGIAYDIPDPLRVRLRELLPFRLTPGQLEALRAIGHDLRSPSPMARLLQGDVGCGKTVVALLTMLVAVENGFQAALMAPTEVLAEQHLLGLRRLLEPTGLEIGLLTGSGRAPERRRIKERLATGELKVVVGTHALIQEDVRFARLGLVVIDEQHRFGVAQRVLLSRKGMHPDVLVMTATPIPRSLALAEYGDLDHVEIRDRPPGRRPVRTLVRPESVRPRVLEYLRREVGRGRQAFIVYPLVAETEKLDLAAAQEAWTELVHGPLRGLPVGLLHGRLPSAEKEAAMAAFVAGRTAVLVATTVIEVGVDVPNATLLVIEHAERFGLAQLHQLRGRVGRGAQRSLCVLLHGPQPSAEAARRLEVLARTHDGFEIARADLAMRGPGELLGLRQHGPLDLRLADLVRDEEFLERARTDAARLMAAGLPGPLAQAALRRWGRRVGLLAAG